MRLLILSAALLGVVTVAQAEENCASKDTALQVLDDFMTGFNARDYDAWYATYHFPHIRIAGGNVAVAENREALSTDVFDQLVALQGWDHSAWDTREVIQCTDDKVHIAVTFTRYDKDDKPIQSYQSLYVVTEKEGRWGIQARSSFAP